MLIIFVNFKFSLFFSRLGCCWAYLRDAHLFASSKSLNISNQTLSFGTGQCKSKYILKVRSIELFDKKKRNFSVHFVFGRKLYYFTTNIIKRAGRNFTWKIATGWEKYKTNNRSSSFIRYLRVCTYKRKWFVFWIKYLCKMNLLIQCFIILQAIQSIIPLKLNSVYLFATLITQFWWKDPVYFNYWLLILNY